MTRLQMHAYIFLLVEQAGSQKALAKSLGISESYLSDVLHFRREPGEKLLGAIGVKAEVVYGFTDPPINEIARRLMDEN